MIGYEYSNTKFKYVLYGSMLSRLFEVIRVSSDVAEFQDNGRQKIKLSRICSMQLFRRLETVHELVLSAVRFHLSYAVKHLDLKMKSSDNFRNMDVIRVTNCDFRRLYYPCMCPKKFLRCYGKPLIHLSMRLVSWSCNPATWRHVEYDNFPDYLSKMNAKCLTFIYIYIYIYIYI